MKHFEFYKSMHGYILTGVFPANVQRTDRAGIRRASSRFLIKDERLFYTGPSKQYMRLVVLSEDEKQRVLEECHNNAGNHCGIRGTRNRVIAGYYWATINNDVIQWVTRCQHCHLSVPIKTKTPILQSMKVKQPWEVVYLDLIGPLQETSRGNKYVVTMTDLYSKWVAAECLSCKNANQVSTAIVSILYTFGIVRKIITNLRMEIVNELNEEIFNKLKLKQAISSASSGKTNETGGKTSHNVNHMLRKCFNEAEGNWDRQLPAAVYSINTSLKASTKHAPYFLMFHRHPNLLEVVNACPLRDDVVVGDPEEDIDNVVSETAALSEKVRVNIQKEKLRRGFQSKKRKLFHTYSVNVGDNISIPETPKKRNLKESLLS